MTANHNFFSDMFAPSLYKFRQNVSETLPSRPWHITKKKKQGVYKEKPFSALKIAELCQRSEKYAATEARKEINIPPLTVSVSVSETPFSSHNHTSIYHV